MSVVQLCTEPVTYGGMVMKAVPIGISVLSLMPWSLGSNGMFWVNRFAREHGLGLQLAPMRGWTSKYLPFFPPDRVLAYESMGDVCHTRRRIGLTTSNEDVFVTACRDMFPDAVEVGSAAGCIKTAPLHRWDESDYVEHHNVVLDLWCVRERIVGYEPVTPHPISFISDLLRANNVRLVHVHTRSYAELQGFLRGEKSNFLTQALLIVQKYQRRVPITIEVPAYWLWPKPERVVLNIRTRIHVLLNSR
jgi:hypothetical protein